MAITVYLVRRKLRRNARTARTGRANKVDGDIQNAVLASDLLGDFLAPFLDPALDFRVKRLTRSKALHKSLLVSQGGVFDCAHIDIFRQALGGVNSILPAIPARASSGGGMWRGARAILAGMQEKLFRCPGALVAACALLNVCGIVAAFVVKVFAGVAVHDYNYDTFSRVLSPAQQGGIIATAQALINSAVAPLVLSSLASTGALVYLWWKQRQRPGATKL
jgi:hypothetical protein